MDPHIAKSSNLSDAKIPNPVETSTGRSMGRSRQCIAQSADAEIPSISQKELYFSVLCPFVIFVSSKIFQLRFLYFQSLYFAARVKAIIRPIVFEVWCIHEGRRVPRGPECPPARCCSIVPPHHARGRTAHAPRHSPKQGTGL